MNLPFYAENSIFQLWTAIAYLVASSLFFSVKRENWEYFGAGFLSLYVAFDERFMFHECIRLIFPNLKTLIGGDFVILALSLVGMLSGFWAVFKLSKNKFEIFLYFLVILLCVLEIYLDVYDRTLFYLELDVKIEEVSEMILALVLILIGALAGVEKKVIFIAPALLFTFFSLSSYLDSYIWLLSPKLKAIQ